MKESVHAADYQAYLTQYPEGGFAAFARARLDKFTDNASNARDPADREIELAFWESIRESDNPESVQAYLDKYPCGEFRSLAEYNGWPRQADCAAPPDAARPQPELQGGDLLEHPSPLWSASASC